MNATSLVGIGFVGCVLLVVLWCGARAGYRDAQTDYLRNPSAFRDSAIQVAVPAESIDKSILEFLHGKEPKILLR